MYKDLFFFVLAFLSEVIGTVGGFGSSVFFVPLAGLLLDFKTVLGLTALLHIFSNISKLSLFRKGIQWREMGLIGAPSVLFVLLGAWLSNQIQGVWISTALGLFLICFSLLLLWNPDYSLKPSPQNLVSSGIASGFLAGLTGTGGAIRGMALAALNLEKGAFIATSAAIDFGVDFSRALVYLGQGYVTEANLWYVPGLVIVAFGGSWLGKQIVQKLSQQDFRRIALWMILTVGLLAVFERFL